MPKWAIILIAVALIFLVAWILFAPTIDLPATTLRSSQFELAFLIAAALALLSILSIADLPEARLCVRRTLYRQSLSIPDVAASLTTVLRV